MLIVLSGPSGAGKSTVLRRLLDRFSGTLRLSVSATTRPARPGEKDGVDYYFVAPETFRKWRDDGEFLECCEVFGQGHWYGTLRREVRSSLQAGKWVVLEIDVEGARTVLGSYPDAVTVFLRPESLAELERRLRSRGTEDEEVIQRRLAVARRELAAGALYRYQVVNDTVERAVDQISEILTDEARNRLQPPASRLPEQNAKDQIQGPG